MRGFAFVAIVLAGCPAKHAVIESNIAIPSEGTAIAIYVADTTFAVIDDRRTVTVTDGHVLFDRIEPAAQLQTLVIEPLDKLPFRSTSCARERIDNTPAALDQLAKPRPPARPGTPDPALPALPVAVLSPLVRCAVDAPPGKHFVRVLHVAPVIGYRANHKVVATGTTATVTSRFSFTTPAWTGRKAELSLFDGRPGAEVAPRPIARGTISLDGTHAVFANPPRSVPARLRYVYDGAIRDPQIAVTDVAWGRESRRTVGAVLELEGVPLPIGHVDVEVSDDSARRTAIVPPREREVIGKMLRLGLWTDEGLHGVRRNVVETYQLPDGKVIKQRLQLSVANASDVPREVWIEERLRPKAKHQIENAPAAQTIVDGIARSKLTVEPKGTATIDFTITYSQL
jgi:hypothetical protein